MNMNAMYGKRAQFPEESVLVREVCDADRYSPHARASVTVEQMEQFVGHFEKAMSELEACPTGLVVDERA